MSMMIQLLFALTVTGSIIVVCLFVLRLLLPNANSVRWHYRIGKMAIVFFFLPIGLLLQWIWSFLPLSAHTSVSDLEEWNSIVSNVSLWQFTPSSVSTDISIILLVIWGMGVVAFAGWQVYSYLRFLKKIQHTCTPVSQYTEIAKQLVLIQGALGIKKNVGLAYSPVIQSPILVGLRKPTIYLPQENSAGVDMSMVLHHELIHLKHNDLWIKVLVLGANALHWFNPLIYVLRRYIHKLSELSCDEEVVKDMSYAERKRYGETILNVIGDSKELPVRFCSSLSSDGKQLKRRLIKMMNVKKMKKRTKIISLTAMIAVGIIGTSTAVYTYAGGVIERNDKAIAVNSSNESKEQAEGGSYELVSVKLSDEPKFSKEEWKKILKQIEKNEVILEEE
ncbi:M56 family metallopeptidase [Pseudogracilibacillus sp. SE30717A]|uniref:M56 family metallopeptidase n=1 Tax=Pseudogracilibacillus sp. SE30717A TaxID=3098293 RepID=UPI00300DD70F